MTRSSVGSGFLLDLDRGVEMAAALQIVKEVALAFIEQVVVEGIFLVDRNFFFHDTAADVESQGVNHDDGAGFDEIGIVDGVGFGVVFLLGDGNLSQDALLFLKLLAQALKRIGDAGGGDAIAGVHAGDVLNWLWEKAAWPVTLTSPT